MKKHTLLFLTGAGISQPSGIPTFRGETGLWNDHLIEDVATLSAYYSSPEKVINFMNDINLSLTDKKPNKAHYAIAKLEENYNVIVVTQNIDTLHEQAGSTNVVHLHGRHDEIRCMNCGHIYKTPSPFYKMKLEEDSCPICSSFKIKQNIILFQEQLDFSDFDYAYNETYNSDLFIQIGTSALVSPACDLFKHAKPERKRVEMNLTRSKPQPKNRFDFRHYYMGNIVDTIDKFIVDIPNLLPICSRNELTNYQLKKDKDRYASKSTYYYI